MLAAEIEAQIATLATRYGAPRRLVETIDGWPFLPLNQGDRYGEVCMVIRRPNGRLLTAIKTFYPTGAFRLLTGGVEHGEAIADALLREVQEETSLDTLVRRFLAVVEYQLAQPAAAGSSELKFATFAFLLDEIGGTLAVQDPNERLAAFHEITIDELPTLAAQLAAITDGYDQEIDGRWSDWGRFRAVAHRAVYAALREYDGR